MNIATLINDLGDDVDLLARQDTWLEMKRKEIASKIDTLAGELSSIMLAQRIKRLLQQKNMVAALCFDEHDGMSVKIKNINDMMNDLNGVSRSAHANIWKHDGYDVELCEQ